jgi:hypothetical protein
MLPVFFGNTIQGGTMVNTTMGKKVFLGPWDAKDPG